MDDEPQDVTTEAEAWDHLQNLISLAAARPSRARFTAVGEAAVKWATYRDGSPRDAAQHSGSESLIYKENPVETIALDHLGRKLVADENGEYTVTATPDDTLVDELGQDD